MIVFRHNDCDSFVIQAETSNYPCLKDWLSGILKGLHAALPEVHKILTAAEELFVNIATYGYPPQTAPGMKPVEITVRFEEETNRFSIVFKDRGVEFNPLARPSVDARERVKQRKIGGLGLFLVGRFMDQVNYQRQGACNIMTIAREIREYDFSLCS